MYAVPYSHCIVCLGNSRWFDFPRGKSVSHLVISYNDGFLRTSTICQGYPPTTTPWVFNCSFLFQHAHIALWYAKPQAFVLNRRKTQQNAGQSHPDSKKTTGRNGYLLDVCLCRFCFIVVVGTDPVDLTSKLHVHSHWANHTDRKLVEWFLPLSKTTEKTSSQNQNNNFGFDHNDAERSPLHDN